MKSRPRRWPSRWHLGWVVLLGFLTFPVEARTPPLTVRSAPQTVCHLHAKKVCPDGLTPDGGLTCAGGGGGCSM